VLASTQELHEKIHELANRVRELEDALRSDHAQLSNEQHPLLSEDLLKIKAPLQRDIHSLRTNSDPQKEEESNPDVVDAFGSLSISLSGKTKFFGQIANSWVSQFAVSESGYLTNRFPHSIFSRYVVLATGKPTFLYLNICVQNEAGEDDETNNLLLNLQNILPAPVLERASALPISPTIQSDTLSLQTLFWYLPPATRAAELRSIYYRHAAWM
jgi:hypothetical protein